MQSGMQWNPVQSYVIILKMALKSIFGNTNTAFKWVFFFRLKDTAKGLFGFNSTNPSGSPSISENLIQVNIYFDTLIEVIMLNDHSLNI